MNFLEYLFGRSNNNNQVRKRVFISFAIEDEEYRDYLVQQARDDRSPFDFIDMSVKQPWHNKLWQQKCRTKIRKCHGMIVLLSRNTYHSQGVRWEIKCAIQEGVSVIGMHIRKNDRGAVPPELQGKKVIIWSWPNLKKYIDSL